MQHAARAATALAIASAAVSLAWTLGITWLLDTVGGGIEELARDRSAGAVALGAGVVALKLTAAGLAAMLTRPAPSRTARRLIIAANAAAAVVLIVWGGANVLLGALVLMGVIVPSGAVDRHALRWHVLLWDPWFVVWGVALAIAVAHAVATSPCPRPGAGA